MKDFELQMSLCRRKYPQINSDLQVTQADMYESFQVIKRLT
jgi:hypothetical protein